MEKTYKTPIKASRLIELINEGVEAEIVDAEGVCEKLRCIDIDYTSGEPIGGLTARCYWPEDTATCGLDFGTYEVEVEGVWFRAGYNGPDCGHNDFEISGREIKWDKNEDGEVYSESDVIDALEEHCYFPEYDPEGSELDVDELSEEEIYDGLRDGDAPRFFAHDEDGELYGFDDESDITEEFEKVDYEDALHEIAAGNYSMDKVNNC